jgi:hypothetical protein
MAEVFRLLPFGGVGEPIELTGVVSRVGDRLTIHYRLTGDLSELVIPGINPQPSRCYALWEHTCFEFFFGAVGQSRYWEVNLSPSGDWNLYRLTDYRQGLTPEEGIGNLPFEVIHDEMGLSLTVVCDLEGLVSGPLDVGVTAVVEGLDGEIGYWAIAHTGSEADFHRRDSFVLKV